MKVRASVKKICDKCKIIHRKRVVRVICVNRNTSRDRDECRSPLSGCPRSVLESVSFLCRTGDKVARIVGIDLPRDKRVEVGLTYIHGIGGRGLTRSAGCQQ